MPNAGGASSVRDFGCGELMALARGGCASLHKYVRQATHSHARVEHEYPSHSLVFTDSGEWNYHGDEPDGAVNPDVLVAGTGGRRYECTHSRNLATTCFIVAVGNDAFDDDVNLFARSVVRVSPEMLTLRRALLLSAKEPERLEALAFSLYDAVSRTQGKQGNFTPADVRMSYAKRLLRERSAFPTTVADIARELNLSRFTFTRRFLARSGMTPHAYLTAVRIARAKEALRAGGLSVGEISRANGFGSSAHFSNAFRRIVGCSPSDYRRIAKRP